MFSKQQRTTLAELSVKVFGSESKWKKEYDRGMFSMPDGFDEVTEPVTSVQLAPKRKGRFGQIIDKTKAIAKGLVREGDIPDTQVRQVKKLRSPSFDEIVTAMNQVIYLKKLGALQQDSFIKVMAYKFFNKEDDFQVSLMPPEGEDGAKELEDLLASLDEGLRAKVSERLQTADNKPVGIPVPSIDFVSNLVFTANYTEDAKEFAESALESADIRPPKRLPYNIQISSLAKGTPVRGYKEKRKTRNKIAKASRKANR